jgi:hypothetical protein
VGRRLRRRSDGGLFDELAGHLDALADQASQPLEANPELYPDPRQHPDRYKATTQEAYEREREASQARYRQTASSQPPIEQIRGQLRRQAPQDPMP